MSCPEPKPPPPRFTLLQLLIAVTAIAVMLGISVPLIRSSIQSSREHTCINNLKHWSLAIHNYHDTYNVLPPLASDPDGWTWQVIVWPFM